MFKDFSLARIQGTRGTRLFALDRTPHIALTVASAVIGLSAGDPGKP
jgi:hypothetical protein